MRHPTEYHPAERRLISIVIPIRCAGSADTALNSIKQTGYPVELMEVFVIEGKHPSRQRNEAIKKAKGEIVFFFDDDSVVESGLFDKVLYYYLNNKEVAAIGGPSLMTGADSLLERSFSCVLTSIFGVFKIRARYKKVGTIREATEYDLILCNLSIRKTVLDKEGGFDERLYPNEENELIHRLKSKGYKLIYDPDIIVYRQIDKTLKAFCRRLFNYGRGRMKQTFIRPSLSSSPQFIPLIFLFYLCFLAFSRNPIFAIPFLIYAVAAFVFSLLVAIKERAPFLVVILPFIFFMTHISYGAGLFRGLIDNRNQL